MRFKNIKHEERFIRACEDNQVDVTDTQLRGALYLLTYKKKVWRYFKDKVECNDRIPPYYFLDFNSDNRTDINLVNAAYDIHFSSDELCLSDLADPDIVTDEAYKAIVNAIDLVRGRASGQEVPEPIISTK